MITHDAVRDLLKERKAAEHVVRGGMEGLVDRWEATVKSAQKGYEQGLDEWRNEVDGRHLLSFAMDVAHPAQKKSMKLRLDAADAKFWKATESSDACVWGAAVGEREKWTATKEWWYFLVPKKAGDELTKELAKLAPKADKAPKTDKTDKTDKADKADKAPKAEKESKAAKAPKAAKK